MRTLIRLGLAVLALSLLSCSGDPKTPGYWEKAIKGGRVSADRIRTVGELRKSGYLNPTFVPMLGGLLASEKKDEVRAEIAKVLGDVADPSSVQPLADAIQLGAGDTQANRLNREVAGALARIPGPTPVPPLMRLLKAKDGFVQLEAIRGLGEHHAKEAVDALISLATDDLSEPLINRRAVQALGNIGDPKAVPALVKMMFKTHRTRGDTFYGDSSFALVQIGAPARDAVLAVLTGEDKELFAWAKENGIDETALYAKAAQVVGDLHDGRGEKVLVQRLAFQSADPDMTMLMRMTVADALGRLRSQQAVGPIAGLAKDERFPARERYVWALGRIGGREAIPALAAAAAIGPWDARERAVEGVTLLGDEREVAALDKVRREEPTRTAKDCEQYDESGCQDPAALAQKRQARIDAQVKRLDAARECRADLGCWAKKLESPDATVRERAALELGRAAKADAVEALAAQISDKDLDARVAAVQALDWITETGPAAIASVGKHLPQMEKQLKDEDGKSEYVRVNEDLKRLAAKLRRSAQNG